MFSGSIPALATPFRDGAFDEPAFRALIDWQIENGSSGLVPCGTTGEAATMSIEEHDYIVRVCVEQAAGRVPVIAGCGSNDTKVAIGHMHNAKAAGAIAALVVPPYYNRPGQDGVRAHFKALTEACDLPIMLYNVPARTVTDIKVETMAKLSRFPTVIGVKDATGDLERVSAQRAQCGKKFCQMSGNDELALGHRAMGGVGCISVTANVAPALCAQFQAALAKGDYKAALALNDRLYPLHSAMFSDASPGPVKYALNRVRPDFLPDLRLPMTPPDKKSRKTVDAALVHAGLI
ncbi:4-hydroxy-tetrahydrodipicolinate synthase [Blastomonas sp.]|uniref:4-hydroxy-tetrahydrodipicolinate synthase n=1 Tax=Blastomonas sp. TaxID=1909299 RepID=UPI0026133B01|nr:4-hydroxy-tetrahydrodipicolinate synthase [Blastomonas sp.]MDM7956148.1 4-hydroxy-tetrahydrodipicolinate synthase [Blastomonas sp.]